MANQLPNSGGSKDKDDDSWGKLASDLFGIQFGGAPDDDDDFDLTEDEPVAAPVPAPVGLAAVEPIAAAPVEEEPDLSFDEPDLSFPEEDETPAPQPKRAPQAEKIVSRPQPVLPAERGTEVEADAPVRADKRDENEKDIWDLLESWNWDEPNRESSRARSEETQPPTSRSGDGRSAGRREDRGPRRERSRDRGDERPVRQPESEAAAPAPVDEPRPSRRPRRDDRPRRSDAERAPRGDRPATELRPTQEPRSGVEPQPASDRPARRDRSERGDRNEHRPARSSERVPDEFASGLDEAPAPRVASSERRRPSRRAPDAVRPPAETDDFAGELFVESDVEETDESSERADSGGEAGTEEPRRRRRRRRRGRTRREEGVREVGDQDEPLEAAETLNASVDDDDDEFASESPESAEESSDEAEGDRENRRPRRRRRRVRRRPGEPVGRVDAEPEASEPPVRSVEVPLAEEGFDDDEEIDDDEEEAAVPISYEGIPSWEEAISYLQRRPRDSRPRGENSSRGRGPHRR